jgi:integrase
MASGHTASNKGKLVRQKAPLRLSEIWSIRVRLQLAGNARDLALFNLALDSKLRGCDLLALRLRDISHGGSIAQRAIVLQKKTGRPVPFELADLTRAAAAEWARRGQLGAGSYLFPARSRTVGHLSTRQYARIVSAWVAAVGLDRHAYGTHSMRRTKASLIDCRTENLRAVQILLATPSSRARCGT